MTLFNELKRRNVFRVTIGYIVSCWLLVQVADLVLENISAPDWVIQTFMLMIVLGFPVVVFFSWAYEVTPEGIKREHEVDHNQSITHVTSRKLDRAIVALLIVALAYFAFDKFVLDPQRDAALVQATIQTTTEAEEPKVVVLSTSKPSKNPGLSIAVLPFVNMSSDPEQEYFSDGISEEMLNALVRVEGLDVASRTSTFAYKGENLSIPQIASELNVTYILEGSVRRGGDQLRITAQLIDARSDKHLWSETYDRPMSDVFAIQSEIANAITLALRDTLGVGRNLDVTVPVLTRNMSAYDLYLRGRNAFTYRITAQDVKESIQDLEQAIALDSEFSDASEALALAYTVAPFWQLTDYSFEEYLGKALELTDQVLAKNPDRSMSWTIRGSAFNEGVGSSNPLIDSEAAYIRALSLDPRNIHALHWLGELELNFGYLDSAQSNQERCLQIEPLYWNCISALAQVLVMQEKYAQVTPLMEQRLEVFAIPDLDSLWSNYLAGKQAISLAQAPMVADQSGLPLPEFFTALEGPEKLSSTGSNKLIAWAAKKSDRTTNFPQVLALLGAYDEIGERSYTAGWYWYPNLKTYRQSEHFKQLIRRTGVMAVWRERGFPQQCRSLDEDDFVCD